MRIPWIDCCKGFAMIMVVLGHCGENEFFFKGLYYIHLPLFIILSGFWLDKPKYYVGKYALGRFVLKKSGELIYPYLIFGIMTVLLQYIRIALTGMNYDSGGLNQLLSLILHLENYANWFLPILFFAEVLCIIFLELFNNLNHKQGFIFFLMLLCAYTSSRIPKILPHFDELLAFLVFTFGKVITFSFFLFLGYFIKAFLEKYDVSLKSFRKFMIPILFISSCFALIVGSNLPMVDLHTLHWESAKNYYFMACWGSISFIFLFYYLNTSNKLLSHIGKNSLIINGTHLNLLIVPSIVQISFYSWPHLAGAYNWGPITIAIGVILVELIFIIPILKNAYPFLTNYKIAIIAINKLINK